MTAPLPPIRRARSTACGSLTGADAGNYTVSANGTTVATITPKPITGAITAAGKVYDGSVAASTSGSLTGQILADAVALSSTGSFADKNVGNGKTVNVGGSLTGADAGNYTLVANTTTTANITPKAITGALTAAGKGATTSPSMPRACSATRTWAMASWWR
ncbi:hypothetical protein G6F60_013787 [Rhizopus arrhizus]|nr:hypothetical protein G6F60_013787 [Rhizopus arrhizus]